MTRLSVLFWNGFFVDNIMFIYFLGVLLAFVEAKSLKKSFSKGLKFAVSLFSVSILGWILTNSLTSELGFLNIWIFFITSYIAIHFLQKNGELIGEWQGMPRMILALPSMIGLQLLIQNRAADLAEMIAISGGSSLAFYVSFIVVAALREQILTSEADSIFKQGSSLLLAMGLLALALIGFQFFV
ncbi:Rnf-Nqr domain containing protein [Natronospora cellulosivora (SeqCode)]